MAAKPLTTNDTRVVVAGDLGSHLARVPQLYATPIHRRGPTGEIRNGTTFFLDCGHGLFGVTARHVYDELVRNTAAGCLCYIGLCEEPFDLASRGISRGRAVDIATYRVDSREVEATQAHVLIHPGPWPPAPPSLNQGLLFAGFPGVDRRDTSNRTEFGGTSGSGIADSINDHDISGVIGRDHMTPIDGLELPPERFDFAGISGAPVLVVTGSEILSWRLAGVVYECGRDLLEIIKIARADFIGSDGTVVE
jgi:hypothetical protein